jgi:hypothetical protein
MNMKHFLTSILIACILTACKKDKEIIDNPTTPIINNLVCNPSFEVNGHGSLNCWNIVKDFTTYPDTFSTVVPTNGGQFSLRLDGVKDVNWDPYAETYITNISGQKIISVSAYVMSLYGGQPIYLNLDHLRGGLVIDSKSDFHWAFNDWKKFNVVDTLSIQSQDSLRIKIIQTTGQNSGAYIDLIELTTN